MKGLQLQGALSPPRSSALARPAASPAFPVATRTLIKTCVFTSLTVQITNRPALTFNSSLRASSGPMMARDATRMYDQAT
jgi:hypothetical protein